MKLFPQKFSLSGLLKIIEHFARPLDTAAHEIHTNILAQVTNKQANLQTNKPCASIPSSFFPLALIALGTATPLPSSSQNNHTLKARFLTSPPPTSSVAPIKVPDPTTALPLLDNSLPDEHAVTRKRCIWRHVTNVLNKFSSNDDTDPSATRILGQGEQALGLPH